MVTHELKWEWVEEAKKLGYTLASEERERQFILAQIPSIAWEISAED